MLNWVPLLVYRRDVLELLNLPFFKSLEQVRRCTRIAMLVVDAIESDGDIFNQSIAVSRAQGAKFEVSHLG